jgi:hypothetical protein
MLYCSPVPVADLDKIWELCSPLLEKATDRSGSRETIDGLYLKIKSGASRLWCISLDGIVLGAASTEVNQYTSCRALHVSFVGGERMSEWLEEFINELKIYAKFNGCQSIEQTGRPGWHRELAKFGFKKENFISLKLEL